jgi:glycogen operon protein
VKKLIRLRLSVAVETPEMSLADLLHAVPVHWHGVRLNEPDVARHSRSLAFSVEGFLYWWHFMFNAYIKPLTFELPSLDEGEQTQWRRVIDTHRPSPHDFADPGDAEVVTEAEHVVQPYSTVVLVARRGQG